MRARRIFPWVGNEGVWRTEVPQQGPGAAPRWGSGATRRSWRHFPKMMHIPRFRQHFQQKHFSTFPGSKYPLPCPCLRAPMTHCCVPNCCSVPKQLRTSWQRKWDARNVPKVYMHFQILRLMWVGSWEVPDFLFVFCLKMTIFWHTIIIIMTLPHWAITGAQMFTYWDSRHGGGRVLPWRCLDNIRTRWRRMLPPRSLRHLHHTTEKPCSVSDHRTNRQDGRGDQPRWGGGGRYATLPGTLSKNPPCSQGCRIGF